LQGRDILSRYPWIKPGPILGDILKQHRDYVLKDNNLTTQEDIDQWLDKKVRILSSFVKGDDVMAKGYTGKDIQEKLNEAWEKQKQGKTKEEIMQEI